MIFFHIDKDNSTYIYQAIYNQFKDAILQNKIPSNEKLPSKRKLAEQLGVSINSVSNAYERLLEEGYIYTIERKGYFIENITKFANLQEVSNTGALPEDLYEKPTVDKKDWLSLSHFTVDMSMFPFKEWLKCEKKAYELNWKELTEIPHPQGPYSVRQTIAQLATMTRGVTCEPEQVVIGSGTLPLISQVMQLQKKNTKVAVENPGNYRIHKFLKDHFDVYPIDLDKKGINIDKVEEINPNFLFITPSHQYPTGTIMPISRRIEVLNWATRVEGRYIVEDDYNSAFKYGTDNIPSLQCLDRNQRVIYVGSFSKTLSPNARMSYLILPPEMLREYRKHYSTWVQGSNTLNLFTLHHFIENGEYTRHVKRMSHHYERKRKLLLKELQTRFKNEIEIKNASAGLHFLVNFSSNKPFYELEQRAKQEKLEISTIQRFMLEEFKNEEGCSIVLGFANIKDEDIPEAVDRLYHIVY
ncbi:MocR-like transcriptional regulator GabR [Virgibacillus sediminis]|uniref:PLP-dependent aminotransferase family protein n=1 Tax=Virgibacillus sediminis TaxID=202260 RepID=A0ABV7A511_9BACI